MQLTERQRWDVLRQMVKDKNDEYSSFLLRFLDSEQMRKVLGYTRETFLKQSNFLSMDEFYAHIRKNGKEPVKDWLNNLSCEDLLLFLDFRCKVLQKMYKHYKMYKRLNKIDLTQIITETKISSCINYNYGKLMGSGKPPKSDIDKQELELLNEEDIKELAISQTMSNIATTWSTEKQKPIDECKSRAIALITYNVNEEGRITGHRFMGTELAEGKSIEVSNRPLFKIEREEINDIKMVGYDITRTPVFIRNGQFINFLGELTPNVKVVYDINYQPIEEDVNTIFK